MKQFFKSLWTVAALATVFAGCSKDEAESPANKPREISMSVIAGSELESSPASRTTLNDDNSISWETSGEFLRVFETAGATTSSSKSEEALIDAGKAVFNVSFTENTSATAFTYNAIYPESAWVTNNNTDVTNLRLALPTTQKPSATSFDGDGDLLIAYPEQRDAQPTELQVRFKRIVAVGKMTIKNLNTTDAITSVEFIAPENKKVSGRCTVNLNEGNVNTDYTDYNYNNVILSYESALNMQTGMTAYFTCFPFEMQAGETFKVVVTTPSKIFTREVTIPDGRSLAFIEGHSSTFSVDMSTATEEVLETLDGDYVIIANVSDTFYAMSSAADGSRLAATVITYDGYSETISTADDPIIWTISKYGDNYTIQNNSKYLAWTSGNSAQLSDTEYALSISKNPDGKTFTIASVNDTSRILAKNNDSRYGFAFYTGSGINELYLVKFDGEAQVPTATPIGEITTEGNYTAEGTVVARGSQAYIIADNTGAMMVYHNGNERAVGEKISISGAVELYSNTNGSSKSTPQFTNTATVKVLSTDNVWTYNPTAMDGTAMDALLSGELVCQEVQFEGNLEISGNYMNVTIPGALTATGSIKYVETSTVEAYNGKDIIVKGYYVGYSSNKYVNVLPYSVEEANPSTDPAIKADPTSLSFTAAGESKEVTYTAENLGSNQVFAAVSGENASQFSATVGNGTVTVTAAENTETTAKTATLTLYIAASEGGKHLAEATVALTQAGVPTGEDRVLTFDFTSNISGWPLKADSEAGTSAGSYVYSLNGEEFTFTLTKDIYCNGGYLMVRKNASLGLPAIPGYKLVKVTGKLSNSASTKSQTSITSDASGSQIVEGGEAQTWDTKGGEYTYDLTNTVSNTVYYMHVDNTANSQYTKVELTYAID